MTSPRFVLLVPVKDSVDAKSRLDTETSRRLRLRHAFAADAIAAVVASGLVVPVVVGDGQGLPHVRVLRDEGAGDLNLALRMAARRVRDENDAPDGIAALLADLPCLLTDELDRALLEALEVNGPAYVSDAAGTGTTLLASPRSAEFDPHFGRDSARRHAAAGARPLLLEAPTLRLDVDTPDDLAAAVVLGPGPHTRAALAELA